ncbi:MAG TPA: hypothetical protein VF681_09650 [Abditibacteriaceae bacterium]
MSWLPLFIVQQQINANADEDERRARLRRHRDKEDEERRERWERLSEEEKSRERETKKEFFWLHAKGIPTSGWQEATKLAMSKVVTCPSCEHSDFADADWSQCGSAVCPMKVR